MNVISLSQTHVKNQHNEMSWNDDPFDLKGIVTGVTNVQSHQKNLNSYATELVESYAKFNEDHYELDLDSLSSPYQLELARLYIESIDRDIEWACYGEDQSNNSDFLCALLAMLKDSNPRTRAKFAQVTTVNVLAYYKEELQGILNNACDEHYCNEMHEAAYRCDQDMEQGDFVWRS